MSNKSKDAALLHSERQFSYTLIDDYHSQFLDKKTGFFSEKYVSYRKCPVCGADDTVKILDKSGGTYVKCRACTMVYTNPGFTESALIEYYQKLDTKQGEIVSNESDFYTEIYTGGLMCIEEKQHTGSILDMGCSTGFFLDIAKTRGWRTAGIELGIKEAEECKTKGHKLYTSILEELVFDEGFDAITLWDVFEHLLDGKKYLRLLGDALNPNGLIFLQIPNSGALASKVMRASCRMFDGLEHVSLYNPKTIHMLADLSGFEVISMRTVISEVAVVNNYLSYDDPYFGKSDYDNFSGILNVLTEKIIHDSLLGYKIQVILRKKH